MHAGQQKYTMAPAFSDRWRADATSTTMPQTGSIASPTDSAGPVSSIGPPANEPTWRWRMMSARMLTAISAGVVAPMSRPAGVFNRSMCCWPRPRSIRDLDDGGCAPAAGHQAHVPRPGAERELQSLLVSGPVRRDDDGAGRPERMAAQRLAGRPGREQGDREVGRAAERGQRLDDGTVPDHEQQGLRHERLHVDLECAATVARHRVRHDAFGAAGNDPTFADQTDQARLTVAQGLEGLAQHDRFGASASDPARHGSVGPNERLGPGLGRGRPLAADDGGERKRLAGVTQRHRQGQDVLAHRRTPLPVTRSRRARGAASRPSPE